MPITLNHSNISVQYSSDKSYIIETVKSDLYRSNEIYDSIVRNNLQTAPVTPNIYIENGTNNVYAVESYTYSGSANTADFTRVFPKNTTGDILVIGGGGAGGNSIGGGGGAGGVVYTINQTLIAGTYTIGVGKGGIGTIHPGGDGQGTVGIDQDGKDSFVQLNSTDVSLSMGGISQSLRGKGGGGGGVYYSAITGNGRNGGSGGGAAERENAIYNGGSSTQGNTLWNGTSYVAGGSVGNGNLTSDGSYYAAGGGGAGNTLFNNSIYNGKTGVQINITGASQFYAAGGGGGQLNSNDLTRGLGGSGIGGDGRVRNSNNTYLREATSGTNRTGSGGGGGSYDADPDLPAGNGGSGIVIIRYLLGTIPANNLLTNEPTVVAPTFTETTRTFLHSGGAETQTTHTITVGRDTICDILIVGGGGGGGYFGGGAGAGAILFASNLLLNTGTYTIKVGKGGLGTAYSIYTQNGSNGQDSSITINSIEYIAKGGGGGGTRDINARGVTGNSGGSGGGGSHSNDTAYQGLGGASNKNTYTGWLSYGNNGGKGRSGIVGSDPNHGSGGGGGAGSAGGDTSNSTGGGNGGSGLNLSSTFGTSVGHSGWFGGGGGGGTYQNAGNPGYGNGGNGLLGGGGNGGFDGGTELSAQDGLPNTGGGGGGSKYDGGTTEDTNGGHGGSGIVIIKFKSTTPILEGITHKRLNFAFDSDATKSVEYQAQLKTGVGGWRIVRFLPPNINRWYQGNYISNSTFTIPTIGAPYNYTNEWAVPFGTFDEMVFGTLGMTYWLRCLKTSVLGTYDNAVRPIISSSFSSTPYSAIWYNRSYGIDPVISIQNYPTQVVYIEDNSPNDLSLLPLDGGMCVLVRDSATGTTIPNPNAYTLNFPVPTLADINNNSNIVLRGVYDLALSTSNALIIAKSGQYIPPPTTFTTSNLSLRYHLLNPTLDPIGAQWTYSSNNTNVYHMGRVGIGTTNPEYQLDVRGFIFTSAGGYTQTGSENWVVQSDRRIKENIVKASYEKCLDNVKKIELYNFNFKDNCVNTNDKNQLGFIAQEVQQVYPKAVEVGRMTLDNNQGINDLLTLNTTQIKYTLYGAVKNLIERVENIESRVEQIYNMTLSSNIKSSSSNISITFITPLTPLTPNITTNTSNISTNTSNISTNTSNISTNSSNIDTSDMNLI
jgi:hypothetical protein